MLKDKSQKGGNQYSLKTAQRQAFLEVFNLHAIEGRVGKNELKSMFQRIGYFITPQHFEDLCTKTFQFKQEIFRIKDSPNNLIDIKNAFRLIAGEQDNVIPIDIIYQIFRKSGMQKQRVDDLLLVLAEYVDQKTKMFNYKLFLSHLS